MGRFKELAQDDQTLTEGRTSTLTQTTLAGRLALVLVGVMLTACGSLRLKDFNKIENGMSRKQVENILGEPDTVKSVDGRTILEYSAKDTDGDMKPRWVVMEDKEVIFFGRPSEYKGREEKGGLGGASHTTATVSPVISPVFAPVFNNNSGVSSPVAQQPTGIPYAPVGQYPTADRMIWVHPSPEAAH